MRMWMTDPSWMCNQHLLGSHLELHMFIGAIDRGTKMDGYIDNNLLEPLSIASYHKLISDEMVSRGMNHKSPLNNTTDVIGKLPFNQLLKKVNREKSVMELLTRCPKCFMKFLEKENG